MREVPGSIPGLRPNIFCFSFRWDLWRETRKTTFWRATTVKRIIQKTAWKGRDLALFDVDATRKQSGCWNSFGLPHPGSAHSSTTDCSQALITTGLLASNIPACMPPFDGEKHGTTLCNSKIRALQRYGETGERHENIIQQMMLRERTYKAKPAGYLSVQQPSTVQLLESLL